MSAKSKAQLRKLFSISKELGEKFAHETPNIKRLPDHVKKSGGKKRGK